MYKPTLSANSTKFLFLKIKPPLPFNNISSGPELQLDDINGTFKTKKTIIENEHHSYNKKKKKIKKKKK